MRADDQWLAAETELLQTVENCVDVLVRSVSVCGAGRRSEAEEVGETSRPTDPSPSYEAPQYPPDAARP